jgi:hypothetical protein
MIASSLTLLAMTKNMSQQPQQPQGQNINIKIEDQILKGVYSNLMFVSHTKEEFILDFLNAFGPQGIAVAKIITSPGHIKRIAAALTDNIKRYEEQFGKIESNTPAQSQPATSESSKFGF